MSFSSEVKEELALQNDQARHCKIALIAALFHLAPIFTKDCVGLRTETRTAAAAFENALMKVCSDPVDTLQSGREILVLVKGKKPVRTFLEMVKLDRVIPAEGPQSSEEEERYEKLVRETPLPSILLQKNCCRRACLRGMFLAAGSVNDPSKSYHLEIVPYSGDDARSVLQLFHSIGFGAKITQRKGRSVVYLKEGEQISDFLGAMGATGSLMKLENARILRDIAGNINRQVNFEAANLKKTGIAAKRQMEDIALIERTVGISSLPEALQTAARLRLEFPDGSLKEMAEASDPPVGRSGINHRLQRLSEIADKIREQET